MYECKDHEIKFLSEKALLEHKKNHCAEMLKQKNMCTFLDVDGKCCQKSFEYTALLIIHFLIYHGRYACESCYSHFSTAEELTEHVHDERINVRLSKSKSISILIRSNTY